MSGERWNPWADVRDLSWVRVVYGNLPDADATVDEEADGGYVITLSNRLGRRARRCALAHELTHIDMDLLWPPGTAGHLIMRGELLVDRRVAERLIPEHELRPFVRSRLDLGEMCLARDVADEFDVTAEVADLALRALEDRMRSMGVVERERMLRRTA